jgi:tetratricopeptide (TPR) repeat protein
MASRQRPRRKRDIKGQGIQVGDGNTQANSFNVPQSLLPTRDAYAAARDINLVVDGQHPDAGQVVVGDIPQPSPGFRSREDQLSRLRAAGPGAPLVYAVTGMRGVGKTQVAAAHARDCVNTGWRLVAWVNAATTPEATAGLARVAGELGIGPADAAVDVLARKVRSRFEADGEWCLLVLDNVTDPGSLRPYIPAAGRCQVVLTSTSETAARLGEPIAIGVFTEEEALDFLASRTGRNDTEGARELAHELGFLPLALAQAAAVIAGQRLPYQVYLDRVRELPLADYLSPEDGGDYPQGLAEAVLLSVSAVTAADQTGQCTDLLAMISMLSPVGVPRNLLPAGRSPQAAGVDAALGKLAAASLLTFSGGDSLTLTTHRLVARVMRERRARDGSLLAIGDRARHLLLAWALTSLGDPWRDRPAARDFVRLAAALDEHLSPHLGSQDTELTEQMLILRGWVLKFLLDLGDDPRQAIEFADPLTAECERVLGESHAETLTSRHNLARAYKDAGRPGEAIPLLEGVISDRKRLLGESHQLVLASEHALAVAYRDAGRLDEAIPLQEKLITVFGHVLGASHPDTLTCRHDLAVGYRQAGRLDEAIPLHEEVLADFTRTLGDTHPDTLMSQYNLATAYQADGRVDEALPHYETAAAGLAAALGPDHPDTVLVQGSLGQAISANAWPPPTAVHREAGRLQARD